MHYPSLLSLLAILHSPLLATAPDILVTDFEFAKWSDAGWSATGTAFGEGPVSRFFPHRRPPTGFNAIGDRFVTSYLNGADRHTGTLTSPPFKIERPFINLLVGGSSPASNTSVNLLIDGKVLRTVTGDQTKPTGTDAEKLRWKTWDLSDLAGKTARIQVIDAGTGSWGHINLDHIVQSETPASFLTIKTPPDGNSTATDGTPSLPELLYSHQLIPPQTPGTPAYNFLLSEIERQNGRENTSIPDKLLAARELRDLLLADPQRPRYHLLPLEGGRHIDANGGIFHKGRYHLFLLGFESPPAATVLAGIDSMRSRWVWIHASSADLLHWTWHPPIRPDFDGSMPRGLYSGGIVVGAPKPTIILHTDKGTCLYTADDDNLDHWSPHPKNPVIPAPAPDGAEYLVFDPTAWKEGDSYRALIGNKNKRPGFEGDSTSLFKSPDLVNWTYVGPFYKSDRKWTLEEEDAACADFFPIGHKKHMLITHVHSPFFRVQYYIGTYTGDSFQPEKHGYMSWLGGSLGGPETFLDGKQRRLFFSWILEHGTSETWGSAITLPRVLSLDENNDLLIRPAEELAQLRANPRQLENLNIPDNGSSTLPENFNGDVLEILVDFPANQTKPHGLLVRRSPDAREQTAIIYDPTAGTLSVDFSRSTLSRNILYPRYAPKVANKYKLPDSERSATRQTAPLKLNPGEPLKLRVFLDRSILEVYANDRQCITQRIYPTLPESTGISIFTTGPSLQIPKIQVFDISPTNPW